MNLHCAICEGEEVWTILDGDSLCHVCYTRNKQTLNDLRDQRHKTIRETREMVKHTLDKLNQPQFDV